MTGGLTFAFTLEPAEQVRVSRLLRQRTRAGQLWRWVGIPFLILPVALVIALDRPLALLMPYALIVVLAGLLIASSPAIQRWQVRRAFAAAPHLQALTYRFTEPGLELATAVSSGVLAWEGVTEALETDDEFILYISPGCAYYVPKRVVGPQVGALREFLLARLGHRAAGVRSSAHAPVT